MWRKTLGILAILLLLAVFVTAAGAECSACQSGAGTVALGRTSDLVTPITLEVSISKVPIVGEQAVITTKLNCIYDAPGTTYSIKLPDGAELVSGALTGSVDLAANTPRTIETTIKFTKPGEYAVAVSAKKVVDAANVWGDLKALYLTVGVSSSMYTPAPQSAMHGTTQNPQGAISAVDKPWDGKAGNFSAAAPSPGVAAIPAAVLPQKGSASGIIAGPSAASTGYITMSGTFAYSTDDSDYRVAPFSTAHTTTLLVEVYNWDTGTPVAYAWADYYTGHWQTGSFPTGDIEFPITLGVHYYTWVNWNVPPSGAECRVVYDSAGGLSGIPYTYSWWTGPLSGYSGGNFEIGTWYPYSTDPNLPALWLQEDLNRAFVNLVWAGMPNPGQGTMVWYPTSTDGTYYNLGGQVHLAGTDANSADPGVHEYGHNVMYRVYGNWWPPEEHCPSPHYLLSNEDCSCAWTEGWADFLPLAVNRDGSYTWGSGSTQSLETPTWTGYDKGECVEGRVAGAMYDIDDSNNDGADQLSFGLDEIATIMKSHKISYFRSFPALWIFNHGWPDTATKCIYQNTMDFRPSKNGVFVGGSWFRDANNNGVWDSSDFASSFGIAGDQPVAGDWNGDGRQEIGVFRSGTWYLDMNGNGYWNAGDATYSFGIAGDKAVVGDWNANGKDKIGVFRAGTWYLDTSGNGVWGSGDTSYSFGVAGDMPVAGDWSTTSTNRGDQKDEIGVFRNGYWYLDMNGNGYWDSGDSSSSFGIAGDQPVTGHWNIYWDTDEIGVFRNGYFYLDWDNTKYWSEFDATKGPFGYGGWLPAVGYWN